MVEHTIVAIASPPGPGERGVVRLSGPCALELARAVWRGEQKLTADLSRGAYLGRFDDGVGTQPLLLLWMGGPRSFTREDVVEFHLPGSPFLLQRALACLVELGARLAEPGEFTRRAFENGRIDLTRAEGVLALVSAQTEAQRRSASALLFGGLEARVAALRAGLDALRSLCEASLDFDESDTGHVPTAELAARARELLASCREAARWESRRVLANAERRVALVGAPNAGKSSLFNALVAGGTAIVTELAGTTRDVLTGSWELGDARVTLHDTAGLERGRDEVERSAQRLAEHFRQSADLRLHVVDACAPQALPAADEPATIVVWNKIDREGARPAPPAAVAVSALGGAGLDELARAVRAALGLAGGHESAAPNSARLERELSARHRAALASASAALEEGLAASRAGLPLDLFAEHLRGATRELDSISGGTTPEDLLDRIFGAFCLGK